MCDRRILWLLPVSVALAGCLGSERVPLADAVAEAGAYREYIGVPPAALFADLTERDSEEVVFVTVNDDGSITLARADGVEVVLTAEALDEGQGCASEGSGELVCEADGATLSVALVTPGAAGEEADSEDVSGDFELGVAMTLIGPSGSDQGASSPGFATPAVIGGGTVTLPGGGTHEYGGAFGAGVHLGGGLANDSLPGRSPVTQMFETGIADPSGPGVFIVPNLPAIGGLSPGEHGRALGGAASQGDFRGTPRGPTSD